MGVYFENSEGNEFIFLNSQLIGNKSICYTIYFNVQKYMVLI